MAPLYLAHPSICSPFLTMPSETNWAPRRRSNSSAAEPERFLPLALNRLGFFFGLEKRALMYFYSNDLVGYIPHALLLMVAAILLLPFVFVAPSAMLGLALARHRPCTILLYLLFFAYILPHVLILSEDRFHLAIVPFLAILAAQTWTGGWQAFVVRWRESAGR